MNKQTKRIFFSIILGQSLSFSGFLQAVHIFGSAPEFNKESLEARDDLSLRFREMKDKNEVAWFSLRASLIDAHRLITFDAIEAASNHINSGKNSKEVARDTVSHLVKEGVLAHVHPFLIRKLEQRFDEEYYDYLGDKSQIVANCVSSVLIDTRIDMSKVNGLIFLDIDGVVFSSFFNDAVSVAAGRLSQQVDFDLHMVSYFNRDVVNHLVDFLENRGWKIILSSNHRERRSLQWLQKNMGPLGRYIIGKTPDGIPDEIKEMVAPKSASRGQEIAVWLAMHGRESMPFAIIDDSKDIIIRAGGVKWLERHFVHCQNLFDQKARIRLNEVSRLVDAFVPMGILNPYIFYYFASILK